MEWSGGWKKKGRRIHPPSYLCFNITLPSVFSLPPLNYLPFPKSRRLGRLLTMPLTLVSKSCLPGL